MLENLLTITFLTQAGNKLLKIILIIVIGEFAKRIVRIAVKKLLKVQGKLGNGNLSSPNPRIKTISNLIKNTSSIIVNFIVIIMILSEFGVNITPIITGAGILGLAVGFGAKSLVADLIAGFFIIFENQFNVGDTIEIAGHKGKVVKITIRAITLKDKDKNRYIIPNSAIKTVKRLPRNK